MLLPTSNSSFLNCAQASREVIKSQTFYPFIKSFRQIQADHQNEENSVYLVFSERSTTIKSTVYILSQYTL